MTMPETFNRHQAESEIQPFHAFPPVIARVASLANDYIASLPHRPVAQAATPATMAAALDEPLPETGAEPDNLAEEWFSRAEPGIVASSGPRFFGWVIGGTMPAALAGDWLASAIDQNTGVWAASPAGLQTEIVVLRWLRELFGLPPDWEGVLTSGATMSNLVGLAAARQWASRRMGFDAARDGLGGHPPITVVTSTEIHASALKALATLGIGRSTIIKVPAINGSIDLEALEETLRNCPGPVVVIANAGEVNTGAFDNLDAMAGLCAKHPAGAWLHVDAAFGLFAAVSPRTRYLIRGIDRADSIASDAHKWLNVPYDNGFVFVRDGDALAEAFTVTAAYISAPDSGTWDPALKSYTPEISRRLRALSLWCALKALGRAGVQQLVETSLTNASDFARWLAAAPDLSLCAPVPLNIVCFRYSPGFLDASELDDFNAQAVQALQSDGRVFVSETRWQGRVSIRAAFDNWATSAEDVAILKDAARDIGARLRVERDLALAG